MGFFTQPPQSMAGQSAVLTAVTPAGIHANASGEVREAPILLPAGYEATPSPGEVVALLAMEDYHLCAGRITPPPELAPGEVRIKAASGAYIHLRADGCISLNGLIIGADGRIKEN